MLHDATLLLVEDHRATADAMSETLVDSGFRVVLAVSVGSARTQFQAEAIDVAVVDVHLPDGDGLELIESLHHRGETVPTLFVSSDDRRAIRDRAVALAGCDFLGKPYDPDHLVRVVRSLLDNSATFA